MNSIPHMGIFNGHPVLMLDNRPFILLAGEVHNSSSSSLDYMELIWEQAEKAGLNCLLLPITWELTEPEEGLFDFSLPLGLIDQARAHGMHLVFLWFGAWKNAQCYYAPSWVKTDTKRFRRAEIEKGVGFTRLRDFHELPYSSLSYLCEETQRADARAFSRLMAGIREYDGETHTVLAIQVENETGIMGAAREHSDQADALFAAPVPMDLLDYLYANIGSMTPDLKEILPKGKLKGTWAEVFGREAEELFSAYHIARYVNAVAEAGKREYPLPIAVNCWLNKPGETAGQYPSGGPISKTREIWRFCAPSVDLYAPDIYLPNFREICEEYTRRGEALFIPECAAHSYAAARNLLCIGRYHAACYAPFGIEDMGKPLNPQQMALFGADATDPALCTPQDAVCYSSVNKLLAGMMDRITARYGTDHLQAGSGEGESETVFHMGNTEIHAHYLRPQGACLILRESERTFTILAFDTALTFCSTCLEKPGMDYLRLEEGHFVNGAWHRGRRLNGDEIFSMSFEKPVLLQVELLFHANSVPCSKS